MLLHRAETARPRGGARDDQARRADVRARLQAAAARDPRRRVPPVPRLPHARRPRRHRRPGRRGADRGGRGVVRGRARAARARRALLADLATRHPLPRPALVDFCLGMRDDLRATPIETEAELDVYCHRVAGTVGVVMAAMLGATDPAAPRRADALGQAMQRTNILRDIDEDLGNGRVYLARETLERLCSGRAAAAGAARGAAARPDRARRRALRRGHGRDLPAAVRAARDRRRGRDVPRDPAPDRARRLPRDRGPRDRLAQAQAARRGAHAGAAAARMKRAVPGPLRRARRHAARLRQGRAAADAGGDEGDRRRCCSAPRAPTPSRRAGRARGAALVGSAAALGFATELAGVATGKPFGHYTYSSHARAQGRRRAARSRRRRGR